MALKIIWSPQSFADAQNIAAYIARDSEAYAAGMVRRIVEAVERLADFPRMGRRVSEFNDENVRDIIVKSYRVIYRVDVDRVIIAAIVHGTRLLDNALKDREI